MRGAWRRATVAAGMVTVLAGCGGGGGGGEDFPPEVVNEFLASCEAQGTSREVCQCALDKLEDKYSIEEFREEAVKLSQGEASEEFTQDIVSSSFECQQEAG
jgi:hypothetical protein